MDSCAMRGMDRECTRAATVQIKSCIHAGETAGRWSHRGVVQWREGRGIRMCHRRIEAGGGFDEVDPRLLLSRRGGYSNQNPVLYYSSETKLTHLYHSQAEAKSGESKAQIYHLQSSDNGKTWSSPEPWLTNPGSFPRNRIIPSADGEGLIFPFYYAETQSRSFMMRITPSWAWERIKLQPLVLQAGSCCQSLEVPILFSQLLSKEESSSYFSEIGAQSMCILPNLKTMTVTWSTPSPTCSRTIMRASKRVRSKNSSIVTLCQPADKGRDHLLSESRTTGV